MNPSQLGTDGDGIGDACEAIMPPPARDTTAPDTTIGKVKVKSPKGKGKAKRKGGGSGKATIVFASTEPDATSFDCTLDRRRLRKCASPLKLKRLKPGRHKFTVAARDSSGNVDQTPAKAKLKVKKPRKKQRQR